LEPDLQFKSDFISAPDPDPPKIAYTLDSFSYSGHSGGLVFDIDGRIIGVMSQTRLHPNQEDGRQLEISYCIVTSVANIEKEVKSLAANQI